MLLGVLAAVLLGAGGAYVNKYVPGVKGLIRGHLPVSVFGLFIVCALVLNPLLGRIRRSWRLVPGEVALVFAMALAACAITDAGLMRYFPRSLVQPLQQNRTYPGWQAAKVLEQTPPALLANNGRYSEEVVDNYVTAMGRPGHPIPITAVPWHAWWRPLAVWGGLIALTYLAVLSLSALVHPQWADRERIRYPLAEVANALLRQDATGRPAMLGSRAFWIGAGILLLIRALLGLKLWFPRSIAIPLTFDFVAIKSRFPVFMQIPGASYFAEVAIYPACVGLTYLLASDIGFSLGISNLLSVIVLGLMISFGVQTAGGAMTGGVIEWQNFGSFLAMTVMLLYTGRRYYWQALKGAATFRPQPDAGADAPRACRLLLLCVAGAVAILASAGLPWSVAVPAVAAMLMMFLVLARMNAECGTFFFAPAWQAPAVVAGLFGLNALGPRTVIILGLMMFVLSADPFECLMPYAVNGLRMTTQARLDVYRVAVRIGVALLLTLALAVPLGLWADYNHAAEMRRGMDTSPVYNAAVDSATRLSLTGDLDRVNGFNGLSMLLHMRPQRRFLAAAGVGFACLLACSLLRLRYPWWMLHPVAILSFGAGGMAKFCTSFFIGWLIKAGMTRFGGAARYADMKPLMMGVIVGDLTGGFLIMLTSWIYYAVTGTSGAGSTFIQW
jgi:hypothetical protein